MKNCTGSGIVVSQRKSFLYHISMPAVNQKILRRALTKNRQSI